MTKGFYESEMILEKAFDLAESSLEYQNEFNIAYSGTTCCMVFINENKILCANCGDSRAIVGAED
jgi:serine/threonine protein phosphatase PrpC